MGTAEKINEITKLISTFDEETLNRYFEMAKREASDEQIVAYTVQGEPLTKEMYIQKVKDADASISAGRYTTMEDLEKEMETW